MMALHGILCTNQLATKHTSCLMFILNGVYIKYRNHYRKYASKAKQTTLIVLNQ